MIQVELDGDPFLLEYLNWDGGPFQILTRERSTIHLYGAKMFINEIDF